MQERLTDQHRRSIVNSNLRCLRFLEQCTKDSTLVSLEMYTETSVSLTKFRTQVFWLQELNGIIPDRKGEVERLGRYYVVIFMEVR